MYGFFFLLYVDFCFVHVSDFFKKKGNSVLSLCLASNALLFNVLMYAMPWFSLVQSGHLARGPQLSSSSITQCNEISACERRLGCTLRKGSGEENVCIF